MKSTGVIRKVDPLGRVVIPMELRRNLDIKENDPMEIYVDGETIMLKKHKVGCFHCGEIRNLTKVCGLYICPECLEEFREAARLVDEIRSGGNKNGEDTKLRK